MCQNYVGYYRVSTEKQGRSGLGLEAQQTAVEAFIASRGSDAKRVASYVEVESGKRSDNRPELTKAMEHARLTGATLLMAGALNSRGYATPRGGRWTARSVLNVTRNPTLSR